MRFWAEAALGAAGLILLVKLLAVLAVWAGVPL